MPHHPFKEAARPVSVHHARSRGKRPLAIQPSRPTRRSANVRTASRFELFWDKRGTVVTLYEVSTMWSQCIEISIACSAWTALPKTSRRYKASRYPRVNIPLITNAIHQSHVVETRLHSISTTPQSIPLPLIDCPRHPST